MEIEPNVTKLLPYMTIGVVVAVVLGCGGVVVSGGGVVVSGGGVVMMVSGGQEPLP